MTNYLIDGVLEIKTYMLFNLDFAGNIILLQFFLFFLIIDLYFLIPGALSKIFNPVAELVISGNPNQRSKSRN